MKNRGQFASKIKHMAEATPRKQKQHQQDSIFLEDTQIGG